MLGEGGCFWSDKGWEEVWSSLWLRDDGEVEGWRGARGEIVEEGGV